MMQKPELKNLTKEEWEKMKSDMAGTIKALGDHAGRELDTRGGKEYQPINFVRTDRQFYCAEVGRKENDFLFHFFPKDGGFPPSMDQLLADVFHSVFSRPDAVCGDYVPEVDSWTVRVIGYANNPLAGHLLGDVFSKLDQALASLRC